MGGPAIAGYRVNASRAAQAGQHERARLALARLVLHDADPTLRYELGLTFAALGRRESAHRAMASIAPRSSPGHIPAHFWIAADLIRNPGKTVPVVQSRVRLALTHLEIILGVRPDHAQALEMLVEVDLMVGWPDHAERVLTAVGKARPDLRYLLAVFYDRWYSLTKLRERRPENLADRRTSAAASAVSGLRARFAMAPGDFALRLQLAYMLGLTGECKEAVGLLEAAAAGHPAQTAPLRTRFLAAWGDQIADARPSEAVRLYLRSLEVGPSARPINGLLALGMKANEVGRLTLERLEVAYAQRRDEISAFVIGTLLVHRGQPDRAVPYLEHAVAGRPDDAELLNNLAWCLLHSGQPDPARALELSQQAIKLKPGDVQMRHTRGVALARVGRWRAALSDLSAAVESAKEDPDLHDLLAETCRQLGLEGLAAKHHATAARLRR